MEYNLIVSDDEKLVVKIEALSLESLEGQLGKVESAVKSYELEKENEAEYNANHSKCCDALIEMGRCSECLEGV